MSREYNKRSVPLPGESLSDFRCRRFAEAREQRREYDRERYRLTKELEARRRLGNRPRPDDQIVILGRDEDDLLP